VKVKYYAVKAGTIVSFAVFFLTKGAQLIIEGEYLIGGLLVTIGWLLFILSSTLEPAKK